jgi:hypothetical protein
LTGPATPEKAQRRPPARHAPALRRGAAAAPTDERVRAEIRRILDASVADLPSPGAGARDPLQAAAQKQREEDAKVRALHQMAAAMDAACTAQGVPAEHEASVAQTGVGRYYGSVSEFAQDPASDRAGLEETNCILFQMKPVETYVLSLESVGELPQGTWDRVRRATEDARGAWRRQRGKGVVPGTEVPVGRDTMLMQQLRAQAGFVTVLVDRGEEWGSKKLSLPRAVKAAGNQYPPTAHLVQGADTGQALDVRTQVDFVFSRSKADQAKALAWLEKLPFAIVTQDYGNHTLVLSYGIVQDSHWGGEPTDEQAGRPDKVFGSTPIATYLAAHEHALFAVPSGFAPPK